MKILSDRRALTGWIVAEIEGRLCYAKVYDLPSIHGINEGRVSKLSVMKSKVRDELAPFLDQCDYNFDRGLDFDRLPSGMLDRIVAALEALPFVGERKPE